MKKSLMILIVLIVFLLSPLAINIAINEYKLFKLSKYIDNTFEMTKKNYKYSKVIADGSRVFNNTNGEACVFKVVRIYSVYATKETREEFITEIFNLVSKRPFYARINQPELGIETSKNFVILTFIDGPYDPWFDIRCY